MKGSRLYLIGLIILVLGLTAAESIYWVGEKASAEREASEQSSEPSSTIPYDKLKGADRNIEMAFGKTFVLIIDVERWWLALPGYQQLALIVAAATILISLTCVILGR
jgi:flagellar basal body-associated protein FliL